MKTRPVDELTLADFADWVDTSLRVSAGSQALGELKLVGANSRAATGDSFSIVFNGPLDRFLPQGIYNFEHDQIGVFSLFIVPIGKDAAGFQYEALINRTARAG